MVNGSAEHMEGHQLVPRHLKADSVAPRLKPFTAMKHAKRELNGLRLCADFVN